MIDLPVASALRSARHRSRGGIAGTIRILVFMALAALLMTPGAVVRSSVGFCASDPVVIIGDTLTDITVLAPADAPLKVTGPNEIVVTIPYRLSGSVVTLGVGFGQGEKVTIVQSHRLKATPDGVEVMIQVFVPASDDTMPIQVRFAPRLSGLLAPITTEGVANTWVTLRTRFQPALI